MEVRGITNVINNLKILNVPLPAAYGYAYDSVVDN